MRQLAAEIRSASIGNMDQLDLRAKLRAQLIAELKVRNPRFLTSRGVKS